MGCKCKVMNCVYNIYVSVAIRLTITFHLSVRKCYPKLKALAHTSSTPTDYTVCLVRSYPELILKS